MRRVGCAALCAVMLLVATGCGQAKVEQGFPSTAPHPQPQEITFDGCPPQGSGGDGDLNMLKNRVDDGANGTFYDVDVNTLTALPYPVGVQRVRRANWDPNDAEDVALYEGAPLRTVGYILSVKHEGTESTNCQFADGQYRDFHVWLAPNAGDDRSKAIVVEVAPRVRSQRPGWTDSALFGLKGQRVRISGWLLMDQEHPEQLGQTRATLWEIHPIMHIEVANGPTWSKID
jgi:hypothetical protein